METDKRQSVRKRTDRLVYAEFGPENGSVLLNLSEAGCSFQSIAPVREERLRFWVSVGDGRKLEGEGRMIWSDAAKKIGGLRFLNPSRELRDQVEAWLERTLVTTDGKLGPGRESEAKRRRRKLREEARAEALRARREGTQKPKMVEESRAQVGPASNPTTNTDLQLIAWNNAAPQLKHGKSAALRGIGAIALLAISSTGLVAYRRELGHLVVWVGSSIAGENGAAGEKGDTVVPAQPGSAQESAIPEVKPVAMPETSSESVADSADTAKQESSSVSTGPAKRGAAQPGGGEEDVPSLWTSVESGDTRAEVVLASRYMRGDGVPQSCAQARVLLEAAVKRGSLEAKQKLEELGQTGCP
jgi:hypothetical protein